MELPDITRWILWYTFWGLAAWDVLVLSLDRSDATISQVLFHWNQANDGLIFAILFALLAHTFWRNS